MKFLKLKSFLLYFANVLKRKLAAYKRFYTTIKNKIVKYKFIRRKKYEKHLSALPKKEILEIFKFL